MQTTENLNEITLDFLMRLTHEIQTSMFKDSLNHYTLLIESREHAQAVIIRVDKYFKVKATMTENAHTTDWKFSSDLERSLEL